MAAKAPGRRGLDRRARHVELVGVANRTPESSLKAAKEFGFGRTYATWPELIADRDVDAVVIGTWPYLHAPITLAALRAGKHVLTQARMAMDGVEARAMVAASLEHPDLVTMVVPAPTAGWADEPIQRLLAEGAIGTLRTVRLVWGGSVSGGAADPWRRLRRYSGNNIMAVGILYEGVARWLGHASSVQARTEIYQTASSGPDGTVHYDVPDFVAITAEFPGRVIATLEISAHASFGGPNSVHLFGTTGTIRVDLEGRRLEVASRVRPRSTARSTCARPRPTGGSRPSSSVRSAARRRSA